MVDKRRMITVAFIALIVAALTTVALYILLVVASFFVEMPSAMQSIMLVGSLLLAIFAFAFLVAFRKLLDKFTP